MTNTKIEYIQFSMIGIPIIILTIALLCVQCCNVEYEPDNVVEEVAEEALKTYIDKTTGLPIDVDLSPHYGPENKSIVSLKWED